MHRYAYENAQNSLGNQENREILSGKDTQDARNSRPSSAFPANATPPPTTKTYVKKGETSTPPPQIQTPSLVPPQISADNSNNPYKRTTGLSQSNRFRMANNSPPNYYQNQANFQGTYNQSVNLETLPDNSEQPDFPPQSQRVSNLSE